MSTIPTAHGQFQNWASDSGIGVQFRNSHFEQVNTGIAHIPTSCATSILLSSADNDASETSSVVDNLFHEWVVCFTTVNSGILTKFKSFVWKWKSMLLCTRAWLGVQNQLSIYTNWQRKYKKWYFWKCVLLRALYFVWTGYLFVICKVWTTEKPWGDPISLQ